ncbi:hypothetical protein NL676_030857 [Syzygium grande]|nr:hypothetical protein NL676_030857 [Syzygium grande]
MKSSEPFPASELGAGDFREELTCGRSAEKRNDDKQDLKDRETRRTANRSAEGGAVSTGGAGDAGGGGGGRSRSPELWFWAMTAMATMTTCFGAVGPIVGWARPAVGGSGHGPIQLIEGTDVLLPCSSNFTGSIFCPPP